MKLSFSTNGWNGRSFPDFVSLAKSLGFSGLELHDVLHTGWTQEGGPFHPENAGRTSHLLFREGVRLTCLDSVCDLSDGRSPPASASRTIFPCRSCACARRTAPTRGWPRPRLSWSARCPRRSSGM